MTDEPISFDTAPPDYVHWKFRVEGTTAHLDLDVQEDRPFRGDYVLKLNSYDLGVDLELADAVQRLRFEYPEVKVVVIGSARDRVFCAGANIRMLGQSDHGFKINFCKFTNETRLAMEDASAKSGIRFLAALNGVCAGGGYELALACDDIVLVDDGSSAVSLPEVPLLGVLPGTGGLTRVVDKRKVRRDHADVFCTLSEGIKGQRSVDWKLVDAVAPRSKFDETVATRAAKLAETAADRPGPGVKLPHLEFQEGADGSRTWKSVDLAVDAEARTAVLTVHGPEAGEPADAEALRERGADAWSFRVFRELDAALLHLRFNLPEVGVVELKTKGDPEAVLAADRMLAAHPTDWFVREIRHYQARVLRRLDLTARSFFALVEPGSCFAGCLFELLLAADRSYVLEENEAGEAPVLALGPLNGDSWPMSHGVSRLQVHFSCAREDLDELLEHGPFSPAEADEAGLVTAVLDDIDYEDEVRVAVEERASLSPDALTGMEASLRFPGSETCDSKIFGRLSAWQNWIFFRPNAVGAKGALKLYGQPERPEFDWRRT